MSEGPQVRRRTEWLDRYLAGRKVVRCDSDRTEVPPEALTGTRIVRAFCKGKHIFVEFDNGSFLHNHLLMRGKWKRLGGNLLFLPEDAWLGLYVGPYTVCNLNGQLLRVVSQNDVSIKLASLGPDAMSQPYPSGEIQQALTTCRLPVSEALLDQSVLAGVGNIAKSEILFQASLHPRIPVNGVANEALDRLLQCIPEVLWNSYNVGGRWECQVYQRYGKPCVACGVAIRSMKLPPSNRATYFCPNCQRENP